MTDEERRRMIEQFAYNRWELRMHSNWRKEETALDDWNHAEHIVRALELAKEKEKRQ